MNKCLPLSTSFLRRPSTLVYCVPTYNISKQIIFVNKSTKTPFLSKFHLYGCSMKTYDHFEYCFIFVQYIGQEFCVCHPTTTVILVQPNNKYNHTVGFFVYNFCLINSPFYHVLSH